MQITKPSTVKNSIAHQRCRTMLKNLQRKQKNPRFCVGENGLCLRFFDSANRTLSSTSTAIYTEVCGNFALVANFADCVARANTNAIFTSNTIVADFVSHSDILLFWVDSIIRPKKIFVYCFSAHCDTMRANNFLFDNVGAPVAPFNEQCQNACNRQINVGNRLQKRIRCLKTRQKRCRACLPL